MINQNEVVLRVATNLCGSAESVLFWFSNAPLQPFGYKTAQMLVTEDRTEDLLDYLASLGIGFTG